MKLMNIAIIFSIVCLFVFVLYTRPRGFDELLKNEAKKREEIIKEIELLKYEKKIIDLSIENIKKYIDIKERNLMFNIQEVKQEQCTSS